MLVDNLKVFQSSFEVMVTIFVVGKGILIGPEEFLPLLNLISVLLDVILLLVDVLLAFKISAAVDEWGL